MSLFNTQVNTAPSPSHIVTSSGSLITVVESSKITLHYYFDLNLITVIITYTYGNITIILFTTKIWSKS